MNTKKILNSEIEDLRIASLPSRPTAPTAFGGRGYTAKDMKEAFDKLPLFIIERFNSLLTDMSAEDDSSAIFSMPSGIREGHTVGNVMRDILSGELASYLALGGESLSEYKIRVAEESGEMRLDLDTCLNHIADNSYDGGTPDGRNRENGEVAI